MMNHVFTRREKALLLVLTFMLIGLGYLKLIHEPVQTALLEAQNRQANAEDVLVVEQARLEQMRAMEKELEALKAGGTIEDAELPYYDNIENVMVQLNAILTPAQQYSLTFAEPQQDEDGLVSRPIQMNFTAGSYQTARTIMNDLYHCWYRCSISNISVTGQEDVSQGDVSVSLTATFYEQIP